MHAIIYLKNGNRKYGVLIDRTFEGNFMFVSNQNYSKYLEKADSTLLEEVKGFSVEAIDLDPK